MNLKQALIILGIIVGSLIFIFLVILGLYKFFPEIFGVQKETKNEKIETITTEYKGEPKIVLSRKEYDEWIQKSFNVQAIESENLFLSNYTRYLQDSLNKLSAFFSGIERMKKDLEDSVQLWKGKFDEKSREVSNLLNQIQLKEKAIAELQSLIENKAKTGKAISDSAKQVVYSTFAKIYENSDPKEVAKILELLDEEQALSILKAMSKKKAGKIIDALSPERSARILQASFEK